MMYSVCIVLVRGQVSLVTLDVLEGVRRASSLFISALFMQVGNQSCFSVCGIVRPPATTLSVYQQRMWLLLLLSVRRALG